MKWAAKSHVGKVRENNEDSFYAKNSKCGVFVVADGMGGHNAGEVASKMAIDIVSNYIDENIGNNNLKSISEINKVLDAAIEEANEKIYNESILNESMEGMGTTFTIAIIHNMKIFVGHVGDSRAYILKNDDINQITQDHTLVCELLKNGNITELEAKNHPKRNIITKALGTDRKINPDFKSYDLEEGDLIILCTDGLTNHIDNQEIKDIFMNYLDLNEACQLLINLANDRGGYDNITIVAIRYSSS